LDNAMMRYAVVLAAALVVGVPALAQQQLHGEPGATVDDLVGIARRMSPDLQVAALEAEAAAARIDGAGSLPDPKLQVTIDDWMRNEPGYLPRADWYRATKKLTVSQELPFWGKRDLRREIAEANARKASVMRLQVENELIAKVKAAHAQYHAAHLAGDLARNLRDRLDTLAKLARTRYAQGTGKQQDATRAEVEKAMLEAEIARTDGERLRAKAAINRLLARPAEAPLAEAPSRASRRGVEPSRAHRPGADPESRDPGRGRRDRRV
jgi:cobalt-zinc-cadmium efflux system outer membrane protein